MDEDNGRRFQHTPVSGNCDEQSTPNHSPNGNIDVANTISKSFFADPISRPPIPAPAFVNHGTSAASWFNAKPAHMRERKLTQPLRAYPIGTSSSLASRRNDTATEANGNPRARAGVLMTATVASTVNAAVYGNKAASLKGSGIGLSTRGEQGPFTNRSGTTSSEVGVKEAVGRAAVPASYSAGENRESLVVTTYGPQFREVPRPSTAPDLKPSGPPTVPGNHPPVDGLGVETKWAGVITPPHGQSSMEGSAPARGSGGNGEHEVIGDFTGSEKRGPRSSGELPDKCKADNPSENVFHIIPKRGNKSESTVSTSTGTGTSVTKSANKTLDATMTDTEMVRNPVPGAISGTKNSPETSTSKRQLDLGARSGGAWSASKYGNVRGLGMGERGGEGTIQVGPGGGLEMSELEGGVLVVRRSAEEKKKSPERLNLHRHQLRSCPVIQVCRVIIGEIDRWGPSRTSYKLVQPKGWKCTGRI